MNALASYDCTSCHAEMWWQKDAPPLFCPQCGARAAWRQTFRKSDSIDVSIAKQLQLSMELNARMKNRIGKLHRLLSGLIGESPITASEIETALNRLIKGNLAIEAILKDEEPTWPPLEG